MPTYTFRNIETNELVQHVMRMSEYDAFKESNKQLERYHDTCPAMVSSSGGSFENKAGDGWKEVISKVAEAHPRSNLGKRYNKRSIKDAKTDRIIKKHVEKLTK